MAAKIKKGKKNTILTQKMNMEIGLMINIKFAYYNI